MSRSTATIVLILALSVVPSAGSAQTPDELFNSQALQRVDLLLHSADWAKLKADFLENTYYPADINWNGVTVRNVGIRSRGHGSRSGNKPGLRVDFDRYATDQQFLGLKSLVLDNLTQDASGIHETVSMALFARLGIPAPREAHARLYVNNEYVGLYVLVEAVDKRLLARVFGAIDELSPRRQVTPAEEKLALENHAALRGDRQGEALKLVPLVPEEIIAVGRRKTPVSVLRSAVLPEQKSNRRVLDIRPEAQAVKVRVHVIAAGEDIG